MNYMSRLIAEAFRHNGLDEFYIQDKMHTLKGKHNFECLEYAIGHLDDKNLGYIAQKLDVSLTELHITAKVLSKV